MRIARLREATAADHEAVEGAVPLMAEDLNPERYLAILTRLHGVVAAWERTAAESAPEWMQPYLVERRRLAMLEADIRHMGGVVPAGGEPRMPRFADSAELLGATYVMEGSRLGGQLIARHVQKTLGLRPGEGEAYFSGFGESTGGKWKELVGVIEARVGEEEEDRAILSAKAMFRTFGEWMKGAGI